MICVTHHSRYCLVFINGQMVLHLKLWSVQQGALQCIPMGALASKKCLLTRPRARKGFCRSLNITQFKSLSYSGMFTESICSMATFSFTAMFKPKWSHVFSVVCQQDHSETTELNFVKLGEEVERGQRKNSLFFRCDLGSPKNRWSW